MGLSGNGALWALLMIGVVGLLVWMARRQSFPPLETKPDDPLLLESIEQARATLGEFGARLADNPKDAIVKLRFVSDTGAVEHLWAEVLEREDETSCMVRFVSPPVTQKGAMEAVVACNLADIEDWQVRDAAGNIHGAFSQRAMFKIARRDGVKLPKKLAELEKLYQ